MEKVAVILVNFNGSNETIECINSIKNNIYSEYSIIVVDNGSDDYEYNILKNKLIEEESVILIRINNNLGFAGGNNKGIEYALKTIDPKYILLLNNDTIIDKEAIYQLVSIAQKNNNIGIVGAKIYYYKLKKKIWYAGGHINWRKFITEHHGLSKYDNGQFDKVENVEFITGCCMLINREVINKCGFLSEDYFMYYEDVDYCVKVKESGFNLYYNPQAIIYHKVSVSSGGEESEFSIEFGTRNRKKFMKKFRYKVSKIQYLQSVLFFYCTRVILICKFSFKGRTDKAKAIIKGLTK